MVLLTWALCRGSEELYKRVALVPRKVLPRRPGTCDRMMLATLFLAVLAVAGAAKKNVDVFTSWGSNEQTTFEGNIDLTFDCDWENYRAILTFDRAVTNFQEWDLDVVNKRKGDTVYVLKLKWNPGTATQTYKIQGQTTGGRPTGTFVEKCVEPSATTGGESGSSANGVVGGSGSCQQLDGSVEVYHSWGIGNNKNRFEGRFNLQAPDCPDKAIVTLTLCKKIIDFTPYGSENLSEDKGTSFDIRMGWHYNAGAHINLNFQGTFSGKKRPTGFATVKCDDTVPEDSGHGPVSYDGICHELDMPDTPPAGAESGGFDGGADIPALVGLDKGICHAISM